MIEFLPSVNEDFFIFFLQKLLSILSLLEYWYLFPTKTIKYSQFLQISSFTQNT